ncbi:P-loop containing nucleoside triphosphate hydrolase protein [Neurospora tetraspora]|uniref:Gluconokinase n=1 Tax=Neurospora tetraspora TaxID=94610 RepID=A0AAE0J8U1_9PEZI|nr:P-loop containing nucleoside triphosphate hydrolase protein [Neurospora tetraspora]
MADWDTDAALDGHLRDQNGTAEKKPKNEHRWIWFVTGPTACGKTTVAKALAKNLNFTYVEGDNYHPKANVEKMSRGEPLTDADRAGWLQALAEHETAAPPTSKSSPHLVITCSALKRHYRDILRLGSEHAGDLRVRFIFLSAPEKVLRERAQKRKGHFAGENLVHSQFNILEMPDPKKEEEEGGEKDVLVVDVDGRGVEEVEREVLERVRGEMGREEGDFLRLN